MLPSGPSQVIKQTEVTYSHLGKGVKKKKNKIWLNIKKRKYVYVWLEAIFGHQNF